MLQTDVREGILTIASLVFNNRNDSLILCFILVGLSSQTIQQAGQLLQDKLCPQRCSEVINITFQASENYRMKRIARKMLLYKIQGGNFEFFFLQNFLNFKLLLYVQMLTSWIVFQICVSIRNLKQASSHSALFW